MGLLDGLLAGLTMPSSTAQFSGGYDPGTMGKVDPGVNASQPTMPSWQNMQQNPKWALWDKIFNGGQGASTANQANVSGQQEMLQRSLDNQNALSQQNNVLPYQLNSIAPNMLDKASSGLDAGTLSNLLSGGITRGQLPYSQAIGSSTAGAGISGNLNSMAQNANSTAQAQGAAPYQNELGKIMAQLGLGQSGLDLTKIGQTKGFLQQNPSYTSTMMDQQRQQQQAEINKTNREHIGGYGGDIVNIGADGKPTGNVVQQSQQYDMQGIPHKVIPQPVYQSMGPKSIPGSDIQAIISNPPQASPTTNAPAPNYGLAPGGVGRGNTSPLDINSLLKDPQVQSMIQQMIQSKMPKQQYGPLGTLGNVLGGPGTPLPYTMGHEKPWKYQ